MYLDGVGLFSQSLYPVSQSFCMLGKFQQIHIFELPALICGVGRVLSLVVFLLATRN